MSKTNLEVLGCFWIPPTYYNTCASGANANTIKKFHDNDNIQGTENNYFEKNVLPLLRQKIHPYPADKKYLPKKKEYGDGFRCVINEALRQIYKNRKGFVFSQAQLLEVLQFVPDVNVSLDDEIYFVWK